MERLQNCEKTGICYKVHQIIRRLIKD